MSDVSAEDVQQLRQLRYEEMQKIKSQLKEQDQKWQDVSILSLGKWEDWDKCVFASWLLLKGSLYIQGTLCLASCRIQVCRKCHQFYVRGPVCLLDL